MMRRIVMVFGLAVALLSAENSYGQDYSNKGKDFWVIYTGHIDGTSSRMALYITSDQNASGTVNVAGNTIPFTVTAYQVTTVRFTNATSPSNAVAYNGQVTGIGTNRGIHILSDHPVVVYSHILNSARSGSTLVLPTNVLGREYYVSSYKSIAGSGGNIRKSEFAVVATLDTTTIEITPVTPDANNTYPANIPFQVVLNKGDVFQYQSADDDDLTGTYVKSIATASSPCKPIAVYAGSTWTALGCPNANSGDNLYQELFPLGSWGLEYITAPFINRSYDVFRIIVKDPTTVVQVNGATLSAATLIKNTYYDFNTSGDNTPRIITADKPICVVQYLITQNCDGVNSDPEMIILNSIEQTLSDITVLSARNDLTPPATNITQHYLNIIIKTAALASLKIDGATYTSVPKPITGTLYSYLQEDVTASTNVNPAHRITSDSGFVAIAYGYGNVESYGYNAGTNVKDLYQFIGIKNEYGTVDFPAACKNSPFYFSMTFPYQPTQVSWDFGGLFPNVTINTPVYDSTWVINGKQLYRYKLPLSYTVPAIGTYPIKVFALNPTPDGCSGEQEIDYDLQVFDPPVADFSFTNNGCITDTVFFNDASNLNGRAAIKWHWDFSDGGIDSVRNTMHKYLTPGSYTVKYSVITDIGCLSDTASKQVNLSAVPFAQFNPLAPLCAGQTVTFNDASTISGVSTLKQWVWNFGDGSLSLIAVTNVAQSYVYPATGTYNVTLQVQSNTGCLSPVQTKAITISPVPVAGFISPEVCLTDPIAPFIDTSRVASGAIAAWNWNFGDPNATPANPNISALQNPGHRYISVGSYTANLIVTSNKGCRDTVSQTFTVNGSVPLAGYSVQSPAQLCSNDSVNIVDGSTVDFGNIVKVEIYWDFANNPAIKTTDDIPAPGKTYKHLYPEFGSPATKNYSISYVAYSGINCVNTITKTITVLATPSLEFDALNPVCANDPSFQVTAQLLNGLPGSGVFTGAGISGSGLFNPSVAGAGVDTIRYTYTASNSCINYLQQPIIVYPVPTVDAGPDLLMLQYGQTILQGSGSGNNVSFLWSPNIFLNNPAIAQPIAMPPDDIEYTLTVTSVDGCKASDDVFIKVLKLPVIPNIFSPNGDGIHDKWEIAYLSTYPGCTVQIYNRYGQLIFHSTGYDKPWDGTINGKPVPMGTYYYIVDPKNGRQKMTGYVDVIR